MALLKRVGSSLDTFILISPLSYTITFLWFQMDTWLIKPNCVTRSFVGHMIVTQQQWQSAPDYHQTLHSPLKADQEWFNFGLAVFHIAQNQPPGQVSQHSRSPNLRSPSWIHKPSAGTPGLHNRLDQTPGCIHLRLKGGLRDIHINNSTFVSLKVTVHAETSPKFTASLWGNTKHRL